ncbi:MAG: hypothetical protein IJP37_04695 [Clostridia bacterium]|nr:hypothetical protein [Clostridia bacterium]
MPEIDSAAAFKFVLDKFKEQGDYSFLKEGELESMVSAMQAMDEEYMKTSGVDEGGIYDDEAAFDQLFAGMQAKFPEYKMYCMRLAEDYMDYYEEYLESIGAIEWE